MYTLVIEFYDVINLNVRRLQREEVFYSKRLLFTINPIIPDKGTRFSYRYNYMNGVVNPRKIDPAFIYRLPYSESAGREARNLTNVYDSYFGGDDRSVNFKAFQFTMNRGDTVYASRKGSVVRVIDKHDPLEGVGEVSLTENNEVYVQHADGTIARYGVLEKGSITVKPGDTVFPGTPIGLAGTLDGEIYQLRFYVYYQTDNLDSINALSDHMVTYTYIDPVFATSEGETTLTAGIVYTPVCRE